MNGYAIELTFSDGVRGTVDLASRIIGRGGAFAPLEAPDFFRRVSVDDALGTIVWPNGVDFCPDMLHLWVTGEAISRPESEAVAS